MAGNGGGNGGPAASIVAAAAAAGTSEGRFPAPLERRSRWGGCLSLFACYGSQKKAKRIVPSSRIPDGSMATNRGNASQPSGLSNQAVTLILAPPSSPASFSNSALPSTAQSPNCFLSLSANSPGEFSNPMFVTGPYAHETQLVSPPVFSTYTTEPSTAPLTPPPELAHLTTPSSPDVPYAQYLSSSLGIKTSGKENGVPYITTGYAAGNDLQAAYALYPGSPASSLISPISGTPRTGMSSPFPERDAPTRWGSMSSSHGSRNRSPKDSGVNTPTSKNFLLSPNSSFFYPASSAQFHLDQAQQSYSSGAARLSISRETDPHSGGGNQHSKTRKQDVEEVVEAYRASFGFSADELLTTPAYVEISDPVDISFNVPQLPSSNLSPTQQATITTEKGIKEIAWPAFMGFKNSNIASPQYSNSATDSRNADHGHRLSLSPRELHHPNGNSNTSPIELPSIKTRDTRGSRSFRMGLSVSDAEIDYRRSRSLKHGGLKL